MVVVGLSECDDVIRGGCARQQNESREEQHRLPHREGTASSSFQGSNTDADCVVPPFHLSAHLRSSKEEAILV